MAEKELQQETQGNVDENLEEDEEETTTPPNPFAMVCPAKNLDLIES